MSGVVVAVSACGAENGVSIWMQIKAEKYQRREEILALFTRDTKSLETPPSENFMG